MPGYDPASRLAEQKCSCIPVQEGEKVSSAAVTIFSKIRCDNIMEKELSHFDTEGKAKMVNVGAKTVTERIAIARSTIRISADLVESWKLEPWPKEMPLPWQKRPVSWRLNRPGP